MENRRTKFKNFFIHVLLYHYVKVLLDVLIPNFHLGNRLRGYFVGRFFCKCGKNFAIAPGFTITMARRIEVGDNVYIAHDVWINAVGGLYIGDGAIISPRVVLATSTHAYRDGAVRLREGRHDAIRIGSGSWVVSNSVVTKGVSIGDGAIVAAGSVVTRDVESGWMYGGQPAGPIKLLSESGVEKPTCDKELDGSVN